MDFHSRQVVPEKRKFSFALVIITLVAGAFLTQGVVLQPLDPSKQIQLTSTTFKNMQPIPRDYTCDGRNVSPPLAWSGAPAGTKSFALIVDDPDAPNGVWTHWIVFDLPADVSELPEEGPKSQLNIGNAQQGLNDFKHLGYGGPCPPVGKPHRYVFKIFALDTMLGLKSSASKRDVESAMARHILGQGQLVGTYQRP